MPSVPWRVEFSKIFKEIKKFSKFQKCPKSFPKVCKHVLDMFWGKLFEKVLPSFPWSVESSKIFKKNIFKIPKMPKSVPKCIQTCFRVIFSKKIYAQCSMEGRVFENFQFFFSKFQKCPKSFPKVSKRVLNVFWGKFFEKFFCPVFRGGSSFRKFLKKMFSKFQKCPKVFPNVSKRVLG